MLSQAGNKRRFNKVLDTDTAQVTQFEQTMVPHLDAAYNLARWLTRNDVDAQDVVQEAYVRGLRYFGSFTGGDAKAWLLAIVRNTFLSLRSQQKNNQLPFDESLHSPRRGPVGAEEATIKASRLRALRGCVESLPVEYRETIVMREFEELSYQSIAEIASVPIGTVMSRLSRARKRIGDCMASKGETR
jgi:RNA polymerase sigma factor (sigma-70 family)